MKIYRQIVAQIVSGLVVLAVLCSPQALALELLIADDFFEGTDLEDLVELLPAHNITYVENHLDDQVLVTNNLDFISQFDVVIFYASGEIDLGRPYAQDEIQALSAYVEAGGHLIVTGYDILLSPEEQGLLAELVRSVGIGDEPSVHAWTASNVDHFILNGPFGDFRGEKFVVSDDDHDLVIPDVERGAIGLGKLAASPGSKIIFTDLPGSGGSVGVWNGNDFGSDWIPELYVDGARSLKLLKNWLAGLDSAPSGPADECPQDPNKIEPGLCGCGVVEVDLDGDGVPSCVDQCPSDGSKVDPGVCGCGLSDTHLNDQGRIECLDLCPENPSKGVPGICGCAISELETDSDGVPDCIDGCIFDPTKLQAGICGCGRPEVDLNGNGLLDCLWADGLSPLVRRAQRLLRKRQPSKANFKKQSRKLRTLSGTFVGLFGSYADQASVAIAHAKLSTAARKVERALLRAVRFRKGYFRRDKHRAQRLLGRLLDLSHVTR